MGCIEASVRRKPEDNFWTCVLHPVSPVDRVPMAVASLLGLAMTLITPRVGLIPVMGLAVRFLFTDSDRRPSGVTWQEQHS